MDDELDNLWAADRSEQADAKMTQKAMPVRTELVDLGPANDASVTALLVVANCKS
jgi:hypothetical protein